MEFVENGLGNSMGVAQVAKIFVGAVQGGETGNVGSGAERGCGQKRVVVRVVNDGHREGNTVLCRDIPIDFGVVLIRVVGIRAIRNDQTVRRGRQEALFDISLSDRVDSCGINNPLRSQRGIRLEVWVILEKCGDPCGVDGVAEIAVEFLGSEGTEFRSDQRAVLTLSLIAEEKEETIPAVVKVRDGNRTADGGAELIPFE